MHSSVFNVNFSTIELPTIYFDVVIRGNFNRIFKKEHNGKEH